MLRPILISGVMVLAMACGVGPTPSSKSISLSQALTSAPELLEFENVQVRSELLRELVRQSTMQTGKQGLVLFPMARGSEFVAAPAIDGIDLLSGADAGAVILEFDAPKREKFSNDRRDALQGLSEREATELVVRALLVQWNIHPQGPIVVERAAGAPYAAAWFDGVLRVNPAFVYLAAAPMDLVPAASATR